MSYLLQLASGEFFAAPLVVAGFAFSIALVALSYMASEFLSMPSLKAFSKLELREIGVTAVIIAILVGLALPGGPYDQMAKSLALPSPAQAADPHAVPDKVCQEWLSRHESMPGLNDSYNSGTGFYNSGNYAFSQAGYFIGCRTTFSQIVNLMSFGAVSAVGLGGEMNGVLMPELMGFYRQFMMYEMLTGLASTFSIGIELPEMMLAAFKIDVHVQGLLPFIFLGPINEAHTLLVDMIGMLVSATAGQNMLLTFIEINVPAIVLPLGIAMRAFPFARKTGSTIIAFCFCAYFIYPLSILVNERIYDSVSHTDCGSSGLLEDGKDCVTDAQCCSDNCIRSSYESAIGITVPVVGGKTCRPKLGDFTKFASTYAICRQTMEDMTQEDRDRVTEILQNDTIKDLKYQEEVAKHNNLVSKSTKAAERIKEIEEEQKRLTELRKQREADGINSVFITPSAAMSLTKSFEMYVSEAGRLLVLHSIFIVVEILLTLTLMKDIALMIGGEPKLLGISKLV